jgi:hypothetical protein
MVRSAQKHNPVSLISVYLSSLALRLHRTEKVKSLQSESVFRVFYISIYYGSV